jgi:CheY-like chemotaxis protein
VLLVDDEEDLAEMGRGLLEGLGYRVTATISSVKALEVFKAEPRRFDLVIADQTMPGMTGLELAGEILALRPDTPVIVWSGYGIPLDAEATKVVGVRAFMEKPVTKREVAKTIRKVLDRQKG